MRYLLIVLAFAFGACGREPANREAKPAQMAPAAMTPAAKTPLQAYEAKEFALCAKLLTAKAEQTEQRRGDNYYDAACCHALDGKADAAFASLDLAIKNGFHDPQMGLDEDLASLRGDARWPARWKAVQAAHEQEENNVRDRQLRRELLALFDEDQVARKAFIANMKDAALHARVKEIDRKTTARVKEVIAKQGWPGKTLVGQEAAHAAWLLIQHADADRAFQQQCLALIEKAADAGEATKADFAYLYDRVAVAENRPQRFGTQYKDGKPAPIEDEARVDERRKAIGLGTMADYDTQMRTMYGKNLDGKK